MWLQVSVPECITWSKNHQADNPIIPPWCRRDLEHCHKGHCFHIRLHKQTFLYLLCGWRGIVQVRSWKAAVNCPGESSIKSSLCILEGLHASKNCFAGSLQEVWGYHTFSSDFQRSLVLLESKQDLYKQSFVTYEQQIQCESFSRTLKCVTTMLNLWDLIVPNYISLQSTNSSGKVPWCCHISANRFFIKEKIYVDPANGFMVWIVQVNRKQLSMYALFLAGWWKSTMRV